jgi:AraC family transcriptional regulator of adaptative response/methylated-DNA-[protein]-cysteine methyltransferase
MTQTSLSERSAAYARMARALSLVGDTWRDRPDLSQCAEFMGLSQAHFQREFTRWAGLSPKAFQSALAHGHAGAALREGASVLDAALESGLSGPSRLHDLFIAHEALTPGEAGSGGKGCILTLGVAGTPFGTGVFLASERGLCGLGFADEGAVPKAGFTHPGYALSAVIADLSGRYPQARIRRDDAEGARWAGRVFEGFEPVPLALYGTPFRRQIWRALLSIPVGSTAGYGEIAHRAGHPKAARAAGAAIGANPVAWCIPCHRALASDKRLHNYHWGVDRKRAMLVMEAASSHTG